MRKEGTMKKQAIDVCVHSESCVCFHAAPGFVPTLLNHYTHCYCLDAPVVKGILPHKVCCKCSDLTAEIVTTTGLSVPVVDTAVGVGRQP